MEALIPDTLKARFKFGSTVVQCWLNVGIDAACVGPTWLPISVIPTGMLAHASIMPAGMHTKAYERIQIHADTYTRIQTNKHTNYIHTHRQMQIQTDAYKHLHRSAHTYTPTYMCTNIQILKMYAFICMYIYIYTYTCTKVCIYIYICTHTHTHTHIYIYAFALLHVYTVFMRHYMHLHRYECVCAYI